MLLQNRAGKTRLAKYYTAYDDGDKHALERDVHRLVAGRDPKHTNFVEACVCALGVCVWRWARARRVCGARCG